jgi:hypothetical protein
MLSSLSSGQSLHKSMAALAANHLRFFFVGFQGNLFFAVITPIRHGFFIVFGF